MVCSVGSSSVALQCGHVNLPGLVIVLPGRQTRIFPERFGMVRPKEEVLSDVSEIYRLVEEMRIVIARLKIDNVEVHFSQTYPSSMNPLGDNLAAVRITMNTGGNIIA